MIILYSVSHIALPCHYIECLLYNRTGLFSPVSVVFYRQSICIY